MQNQCVWYCFLGVRGNYSVWLIHSHLPALSLPSLMVLPRPSNSCEETKQQREKYFHDEVCACVCVCAGACVYVVNKEHNIFQWVSDVILLRILFNKIEQIISNPMGLLSAGPKVIVEFKWRYHVKILLWNCLKVSDIKCTQVSEVQLKRAFHMYLHVCMQCVYLTYYRTQNSAALRLT